MTRHEELIEALCWTMSQHEAFADLAAGRVRVNGRRVYDRHLVIERGDRIEAGSVVLRGGAR